MKYIYEAYGNAWFVDDSGAICRFRNTTILENRNKDKIEHDLIRVFLNNGYGMVSKNAVVSVLNSCVGMPEAAIEKEIRRRVEKKFQYKTHLNSMEELWKDCFGVYGNMVCGLGKPRITSFDFSVMVLLNSSVSRTEQRDFLAQNKRDLIARVCKYIENNNKWLSKLGALEYYYCSEIILRNTGEAELIFSVKKVV